MNLTGEEFRNFFNSLGTQSEKSNSFLVLQTGIQGLMPESWREVLQEFYPEEILNLGLGNQVMDAFYPFLGHIITNSSKDAPSKIYPRFRESLEYLLKGEQIPWQEEPIREESNFERKMLLAGLQDLFLESLQRAGKKVIVLEEAQNLPPSSIDFLIHEQNNPSNQGLVFVICFHPNYREKDEDRWQEFLDTAEYRGELFSLEVDVLFPTSESWGIGITRDCLDVAEKSFWLTAYEEAKLLLTQLLAEMTSGSRSLDANEQHRLWRTLGLVQYLQGEFDQAMASFQHLLKLGEEKKNPAIISEAFWRMGGVYFEKNDLDQCEKQVLQALKLSKEHQDDLNHFYSLVLYFRMEDSRRFQSVPEFEDFFHEILELGRKVGFLNHWSYLATNPFGVYTVYSDEIREIHQTGMDIARKSGNQFRLAVAHQTLGLVYSVLGDYKKVIEAYKDSLILKEDLGDDLGLAQINNGLGYFHYMTGEYAKAQEFFSNALSRLKKGSDFHEVAMTLFNMGANSLLALRPKDALNFLGRCQSLLRTMGRQNMSYHSPFGIHVITGLAHALCGNWPWAWKILIKIRAGGLEPYAEKNEEHFWYHMLLAMIENEEGHQDQVKENIQAADFFLHRSNDNIQYMKPFFLMLCSQISNIKSESENYRQKAINDAKERENPFYMAHLNQEPITGFSGELPDMEWISVAAKMQRHLVSLHQKVEEIHFLNNITASLGYDLSRRAMISTAVDMIYSNFPLSLVVFHNLEKRKAFNRVYYRGDLSICPGEPSEIVDALMLYPQKKVLGRIPVMSGKKETGPLISLLIGDPGNPIGHVMCFPQDRGFVKRTDSIEILTIAASQLSAALSRHQQAELILKQNEELRRKNLLLEKTSTTDHLTNLGNRSALFKALSKEISRIRRYKPPRNVPFTLMFIDMDNFKLINDLCGHAAGDMVISLTSEILQASLRDTDMIFRYGGDEFVILLPETDIPGAKEVGRRIIQSIREKDSFRKEIRDTFSKHLILPDGQELTLSLGVAELGQGAGKTPEILLDHADQALYKAKNKGKNTIVVYTMEKE